MLSMFSMFGRTGAPQKGAPQAHHIYNLKRSLLNLTICGKQLVSHDMALSSIGVRAVGHVTANV